MLCRQFIAVILLFPILSIAQSKQNQLDYTKTDVGYNKFIITSLVKSLISEPDSVKTIILKKYCNNELLSKIIETKNDSINIKLSLKTLKMINPHVSINGDNSTLDCIIYDKNNGNNYKERMTFELSKGKWYITSSSHLIDLIFQQTNILTKSNQIRTNKPSRDLSVSLVTDISSSIINGNKSDHAIFQVPTYGTSNTMVINKTVALQNLSKSLIGNPYDGKFVHLNGSQNIFGVLTDKDWDRILIGKYKGTDSWVKSYGDNLGNQKIHCPSSVGLDQYGNIFVLTNIPRKLMHLTYNDNTESITNATQVPISSMSNVVDICLDDNNSPSTLSDDRIWTADFDGNALFNIQWDGQIVGKYTHVLNSEGESLFFNHPSKVLVFWSWDYVGYYRTMAIIDSDGKRVIIIPKLTSIQNNTNYSIGGDYQAFNFLDETNVSLNALGFNLVQGMDGLYVGDSRNGQFHIFDLCNPGYVGCINKNAFGQQPLWINPVSIFSERMSNSDNTYFPITGGIQEFNTIDKWDENYGVNTFYSGADLVNPVVNYDNRGGVHIDGSFMGFSNVSATIFDANDVEIEELYDDCYSATRTEIATIVQGELNAIGKYYVNFY
jgi:hypothetical protein